MKIKQNYKKTTQCKHPPPSSKSNHHNPPSRRKSKSTVYLIALQEWEPQVQSSFRSKQVLVKVSENKALKTSTVSRRELNISLLRCIQKIRK